MTLTCFFFAYQTVFYLIANKLGAWAPADVPFDNLLNTKFPWLFVLIGGLFPALSEEFIFRMFAIPFLQRLFKLRWLAIVLAAFIWGFGHAGYPNEPFFIRGLEVGLGGVLLGVVMLRFGILTTLVWHYTVDALYSAILLLRSGNPYYVASGALSAGIMLVPLTICVIAYLKHKSFVDEDDLLNAHADGGGVPGTALPTNAPVPTAPPAASPSATQVAEAAAGTDLASPLPKTPRIAPAEPPTSYQPLSRRAVTLSLIAAVAACGLYLVPTARVGDTIDFAVSRADAQRAAGEYLRSRGVDPTKWNAVTVTGNLMDDNADRYILDHRDVRTLNTAYGKNIIAVVWHTRYYQPLQKEEWHVDADPHSGAVVAFEHLLAEEAPGATLEKDSALAIARGYLIGQGVDLSGLTLKDATAEDRKARRDHVLTWEAIDGSPLNIDEAKYRIEVQVAGSEVTGFRRFMKLPEDWTREQEKSTAITAIHTALRVIIVIGLFVFVAWLVVARVRAGDIAWRRALTVAAAVLACAALGTLNGLNTLFASYQTTMTSGQFVTITLTGLVIAGVFMGLLITVVVGFAAAVYPTALDDLWGTPARVRGRDAVIAALVFTCVQGGWAHLQAMLGQAFPGSLGSGQLSAPESIASLLPAWGIVSGALLSAVTNTAALAIGIYIVTREVRRRAVVVPAVVVAGLVMFTPNHGTPVNIAVHVATNMLTILLIVALVRWLLRDNVLAYLAAFFASSCVAGAMAYVGNGASMYRWTGIALFAVPIVVLVGLWMVSAQRGSDSVRV